MSHRGLVSSLFVLPVLAALLACSGGGGNGGNGGNAVVEKNAVVQNRVAEWGRLVGLDAGAAEQELTQAGLIDKVGGNLELNEVEAQAFLDLTFAVDKTFSQGVEEMNRRNQTAFLSFNQARSVSGSSFSGAIPTVPPAPRTPLAPGGIIGDEFNRVLGLRQTALDDYVKMTEQSLVLRQRILEGARILGFGLEPANANDHFADPGFEKIRDNFAVTPVLAMFGKKITPDLDKEGNKIIDETVATPEQVQFAVQPLSNLTFRVGNRFLAFYSFNNIVIPGGGSDSGVTILTPGLQANPAPQPPATSRGGFSVLDADRDFFQLDAFNPAQDIKK